MSKRTDNRNRILQKGESQRKDGRYAFKYTDSCGKTKFVYSWRLNKSDSLPKGKRACKSLRELENEIMRDQMDGIDSEKKKMTVCELYEEQNKLKPDVAKNTQNGRKYLMNLLKNDPLGNMPIDSVKLHDAQKWVLRMKENGYAFQSIKNHKRSLNASFNIAVANGWVRKNPFSWSITEVLKNDTKPRTSLTQEQVDSFLDFVKHDSVYNVYYNAIVVLLNTGLRISELCGLTVNDIDFENNFIHVNHQIYKNQDGYSIITPKTDSGVREIPMLSETRTALQNQMECCKGNKGIEIDGYTNFLFCTNKGYPMYNVYYNYVFRSIAKKYEKSCEDETLPHITPHVLRHTFCTRMANKNLSPNALQYLMGHKNVTTTLGCYTHVNSQSVKDEMMALRA